MNRSWVLVSIVLHIVLWLLLEGKSSRPYTEQRQGDQIKVRVISKPNVAKTEAKTKQVNRSPQRSTPRSVKGSPKSRQRQAASYSSLLPGAERAFEGGQEERLSLRQQGYDEGTISAVNIASNQVQGILDIPLVIRRQHPQGKVFAKLVLTGQDQWEFFILEGNPYLRAVVYESFKKKANSKTLLHLFDLLKKDELVFTLKFETKRALAVTRQEFAREFEIFNHHIKMTMIRYENFVPYEVEGIALEDEHSRKAKRRDRVHRRKLQLSPAFISPIRKKVDPRQEKRIQVDWKERR